MTYYVLEAPPLAVAFNQGKLETPGSLTDFRFYETMFWYSNYLNFLVNLELAEKNKLVKISSQLGY